MKLAGAGASLGTVSVKLASVGASFGAPLQGLGAASVSGAC